MSNLDDTLITNNFDKATKYGLFLYLESVPDDYIKLPTTTEREEFLTTLYNILLSKETEKASIVEEGKYYIKEMKIYKLNKIVGGCTVLLVELPIFLKRIMIEEYYKAADSNYTNKILEHLNDSENSAKIIIAASNKLINPDGINQVNNFILISPAINTGFKLILVSNNSL